jgi:hypothetical protein
MWRAYRTGSGKAPAGEARYYVEWLGVPHTAIDVILVDGESVAFDRRLEGGERVAV